LAVRGEGPAASVVALCEDGSLSKDISNHIERINKIIKNL